MSNRAYDAALYHEYLMSEIACCECGYHRNGAHHPKVKCPKTGRCGDCGNNWPCLDHALTLPEEKARLGQEPEIRNKAIEALTELQGKLQDTHQTLGRLGYQLRRLKSGTKRYKEIQDTLTHLKGQAGELSPFIYRALIKLERLVLVYSDKNSD